MRKKSWDIIVLGVMFLCAACMLWGCGREDQDEAVLVSVGENGIEEISGEAAKDEWQEESAENVLPEATGTIYIDVCGEVVSPGVYELPAESRVYEAVEKAGGMTKKAAASYINQAERLTDGQQIYVPSMEEAQKQPEAKAQGDLGSSSKDGKINLNTASKEELMGLTGIGEVKAESIIKYRESQGHFQSIEDVKKIEGIKEGVFNKIKDQITV